LKNPALFFGGIILVILGIALGIFFLVPNIPHIMTTEASHSKHAIACFAIAVLGLLVALVSRPKAAWCIWGQLIFRGEILRDACTSDFDKIRGTSIS
jgi:hypothetical protein